jgi:hypothetical protein
MTEMKTRSPRRRQVVALAILLLVTAAFLGAAWYFSRGQAGDAKVGDCVAVTGSDSIKVVGCDDAKATLKVVGRVEDRTQVDATLEVCGQFAGAEQAYWQGTEVGGKGLVLCLAKTGG